MIRRLQAFIEELTLTLKKPYLNLLFIIKIPNQVLHHMVAFYLRLPAKGIHEMRSFFSRINLII